MTLTTPPLATPPVAAKIPSSVTHHGITVTDDYAWLRDPGYPEVTDKAVLDHLKAENAWFEQRMAGQQGRIDTPCAVAHGRQRRSGAFATVIEQALDLAIMGVGIVMSESGRGERQQARCQQGCGLLDHVCCPREKVRRVRGRPGGTLTPRAGWGCPSSSARGFSSIRAG